MGAHSSRPGIPLRALAPNAVTALALCTGLSGAWFAMHGRWENAVAAIVIAGVLDAIDGRIARILKGESRFGAELDSLSDVIAFGATPALIIYMWVMQDMPRFGWTISVFLCSAPRFDWQGLTRISTPITNHINLPDLTQAFHRRRAPRWHCCR